jgi:hypothetical protein
MRTTLAIDDDVLTAAKAIAQQTNKTIGEVVSDLARRSLPAPVESAERNGVPLLSVRGRASSSRPKSSTCRATNSLDHNCRTRGICQDIP